MAPERMRDSEETRAGRKNLKRRSGQWMKQTGKCKTRQRGGARRWATCSPLGGPLEDSTLCGREGGVQCGELFPYATSSSLTRSPEAGRSSAPTASAKTDSEGMVASWRLILGKQALQSELWAIRTEQALPTWWNTDLALIGPDKRPSVLHSLASLSHQDRKTLADFPVYIWLQEHIGDLASIQSHSRR
jgi:hypothetical protein